MTSAFSWIKPDETAEEALVRTLTERPIVLLPPPLHHLPLRACNVVEIVGPSPSAKTLVLIQAAINCILPKEWKGVQYGGMERAVMFIDLDCRFDVSCISRALQRRIIQANGLRSGLNGKDNEYDNEVFAACMRRFLYMRCYNSFEFLATLKTLHPRLQLEKEKRGCPVYMLLIDRDLLTPALGPFTGWIGPYHHHQQGTTAMDRKSLSLQTIVESLVQEIQRLLVVHPMVVLATKSAAFGDKQSTRGPRNISHRDFMPSVWQSFVSHRILIRPSDGETKYQNHPTFSTEWVLPPLNSSDHFTVTDDGLLVTI